MSLGATHIGFITDQGRSVTLGARDPYEEDYQGHKQTVEGWVSVDLTDIPGPGWSVPGRSIGISILKEASQIVFDDITDKATTPRADLLVARDGLARLRLVDDSEKASVVAAVAPRGGPIVTLTEAPRKSRLDLFVKGGQPRLDLYGPESPSGSEWTPDTTLFLKPDHSSALLFSHDNSLRRMIGVGKDGNPFFR
jgi:hypothetical protein